MSEFSWDSMVRRADKDFEKTQYVYEFTGCDGIRRFYDSGPESGVYAGNKGYLVDANGNYIVDANGNRIKAV